MRALILIAAASLALAACDRPPDRNASNEVVIDNQVYVPEDNWVDLNTAQPANEAQPCPEGRHCDEAPIDPRTT